MVREDFETDGEYIDALQDQILQEEVERRQLIKEEKEHYADYTDQ